MLGFKIGGDPAPLTRQAIRGVSPAQFTLAATWSTPMFRTVVPLLAHPNLQGAVGAFQDPSGVACRITWTNAASILVYY